jgi:hypothetical protein
MQVLAGWEPSTHSRHWGTWTEYFAVYERIREELLRRESRKPWAPFAEHARDEWQRGNRQPFERARERYRADVARRGRHGSRPAFEAGAAVEPGMEH